MKLKEYLSIINKANLLYFDSVVNQGVSILGAQKIVEDFLIRNGINLGLINDEARRKSLAFVCYDIKL